LNRSSFAEWSFGEECRGGTTKNESPRLAE
jgi:hypothetical protein